MNIFLWVLQVLLALHTVTGAIWKFSNSEQSVPSLMAMPHGLWLSLIGLELVAALALVLPAIVRNIGFAVPVAAIALALEMLLFAAFHFRSGVEQNGQLLYWIVVAAICLFLAYARTKLSPL